MTTPEWAASLRDIKPLVAIEDWSAIGYWGAVIAAVIVLAGALWLLYRTLRQLPRRIHRRKEALEALKALDWSHPKEAAYAATAYGRILSQMNERTQELYAQMNAALDAYKYKPSVDPVDPQAKAQFDLFVKVCDESL